MLQALHGVSSNDELMFCMLACAIDAEFAAAVQQLDQVRTEDRC
jgi:hypothetical protein